MHANTGRGGGLTVEVTGTDQVVQTRLQGELEVSAKLQLVSIKFKFLAERKPSKKINECVCRMSIRHVVIFCLMAVEGSEVANT